MAAYTRQRKVDLSSTALTLACHVITSKARHANVVLSPASIHVVLGLIAVGSKGSTQERLLGFMNLGSVEEVKSLASKLVDTILAADGGGEALGGGPTLAFANGLWVDKSLTLKPQFEDTAKTHYKADPSSADFQNKADEVERTVNAWAENVTKGLIKDLLPNGSVNPLTRLILANALYFKGRWDEGHGFDSSETKEQDFFLADDTASILRVPFMTSKYEQYISTYVGFKVLGLPYKRGVADKRRFSMYIFLPDARDGLADLIEKMSSELGFIGRHLPWRQVMVGEFLVPKFKINFGFDVSEVLGGLGLTLGGGLTEMVDDSNIGQEIYVPNVFHKACVEVNEEGTEAAAATAGFACGSPAYIEPEESVDFVADHPFLFVVREDVSGLILFVGQVFNPLVS